MKNFRRRRLLLKRLREVRRASAQVADQSGILDGDDRLGGEVSDQLNVLFGKRAHFLTVDSDGTDQFAILEHRHEEHRSSTRYFDHGNVRWVARFIPRRRS